MIEMATGAFVSVPPPAARQQEVNQSMCWLFSALFAAPGLPVTRSQM
jgi:hypothetical protein